MRILPETSAKLALLSTLILPACSGGTAHTPRPPATHDELLADERATCHFAAGAKTADTLGVEAKTPAAMPIKHVIVLMKENRSYDHLFGHLHDEGQPESEAIPPSFVNHDLGGFPVAPFHLPTTCVPFDPAHQWDDMRAQIDHGKMDGFVTSAAKTSPSDGHFVMGNYDESDLPFYYWLARTYAVDDRHFASEQSGTYPNRLFMLLATADGVMSTGLGYPDPTTTTIFDVLDKAHKTWGVYSDGTLLGGALLWDRGHRGAHPFDSFLDALDAGTLPEVSFVDGVDNVEDEHPTADVQHGEAWTRKIYEHAVASKLWPGLAIVWTYDEGGGFADHVVPPTHACVARPVAKDAKFVSPGVRVPFVVISPWAKPHYVSHAVHEHSAITRFIETVFDLPALTARDANSDAFLDMFDFQSPPLLHPPPAPAAGTKGCPERW
jgi:phospholipase C